MTSHLLAIDVGNTRTKFGLFSLSPTRPRDNSCDKFLAVPHGEPIPWKTLNAWTRHGKVSAAIAGSNPDRFGGLEENIARQGWPEPWLLSDRALLPLAIDVDAPEKVGIDRLLNAVAANVLRPPGRPAIVIDTGTAAHADYVDAAGRFRGGAILPGFALSAQALHHYTELLPLLTVRELANEPPAALGRNTGDAIRSGIYWGQVGAIKELVTQICRQESLAAPCWDDNDRDANCPWLLLTGGGAPFLAPVFPGVPQVPSLALYGLVLVAQTQFAKPGS